MLNARSRATGILLAASAVTAGSLAAAAPATAKPAHPYIAVPVARVVGATANSLTVEAHAHNATHYKVWASTRRSAVYYGAITSPRSSAPHSAVERNAMTVNGLPYTSNPYWFRVVAINGKHTRYSPIYEAGVRPAAPTNVHVAQNHGSQFLAWSASSAAEVVQQASNSSFTSGVKTYHARMASSTFTPVGLNRGQTYWFRVKAENYGTTSTWSAPMQLARSSRVQNVKVATFNLLEATGDGKQEGGQRVAPWNKRRVVAARLIRQSGAGVVAVEEGAAWTGHHQRQAYNLQRELGRKWAVAHTEIAPGHHHWFRTGDYILYKKAAFHAVGRGNHWTLGGTSSKTDRFAAYQILKARSSGAKFLFVAPHLLVGKGRNFDNVRANETRSLLQKATTFAHHHGNLPIVFGGDFNSHQPSVTISYDGPGTIMRNWGFADAFNVARSVSNSRWDSANLYMRRPPHTSASIDHVYVSPGVGVYTWGQVINLSHGRFVGTMASDHNPVFSEVAIPF